MMKRIVISLLLLITSSAIASAHDCNQLGFKGEINSVDFIFGYGYDNYSNPMRTLFTPSGDLQQLYLDSPISYIILTNISKVKGGFVGTWDKYNIKVTVYTSGNKITKATYTSDGKSCTLTYTYNKEGFLAKVELTRKWTETETVLNAGSARVNTKNYEYYMKKALEAAAKGKLTAYYSYLKKADKAAKSARVNVQQNSYSTRTIPKQDSDSQTYTDYEIDKFGNWISRKSRFNDYNEKQEIHYTNEWLDKDIWENEVVPNANLDRLERFVTEESLSESYKKMATEEWNRLFMSKYEQESWTNDKLIEYADKSVMTVGNRETVLGPVRETIYSQNILPERDYSVLESMLNKYKKSTVLNQDLNTKLTDAIAKLRTDSVNSLVKTGNALLAENSYTEALKCARSALHIKPNSLEAKNLSEESNYQLVLEKEKAKTISDADYIMFLEYNPKSKYEQYIKNQRTTLAYSLFNKNTSIEDIKRVLAFGADESVAAPVAKKLKKAEFREEHGGPWSFALSGGMNFKSKTKNIMPFNVGAGVRFGYMDWVLNGYLGAEYQQLEMDYLKEDDTKADLIKVQRVTFPLILKINPFKMFGERIMYISAGGNYNLLIGAKYLGKKDNKIAYKSSITPRFAIGFNITPFIEAEMYYSMDKKVFYEDKVPDLKNENGFLGAHLRILIGSH